MDEKYITDLFSVKDKVAIVTGGAGRLGFQHIDALHKAGAKVISFDVVKNETLEGVADQYVIDITDQKEVKKIVDEVAEKFGSIDILINNAAINPKASSDDPENLKMFAPYEEYQSNLWEKEIAGRQHIAKSSANL